MARATYVFRDGQLVEKGSAEDRPSGPFVISDGMEATLNHADGKFYDSKRGFERAVRAAGCEIVGNDATARQPRRPEFQPSVTGHDIKRAIEQLRSR